MFNLSLHFKIALLITIFFSAGFLKSQSKEPSQEEANQFVEKCLAYLNANDSIGFKNLFVADTNMNLTAEMAELFRSKLIFSNFYDLKMHLQTELSEGIKASNITLKKLKFKKTKKDKKQFIYRLEASVISKDQTKKILEYNLKYQGQKLLLINAIAYNEIQETKE